MLDEEGRLLAEDLLALFRRGADAPLPDHDFDALALRVFAYQFRRNAPYTAYCERRRRTPNDVTSWRDIPAVPTAAFKEVRLCTVAPGGEEAVFRTSGTTRGAEHRGRHHVPDLRLYDAALAVTFERFVAPPPGSGVFSLIPSRARAPDSSLSYMADALVAAHGGAGARTYMDPDAGLDVARLEADMQAGARPVCLLGTVAAFIHWLDDLARRGLRLSLPPGSRLMDTGGHKGRGREVADSELRDLYRSRLGIPADARVNEYGMTELLSQYYDDLRAPARAGRRAKRGPTWLRCTVVDPETLAPLPPGREGLLRHLDLANLGSVVAVQTEDIGYATEDGAFVLLGRAPGAAPRGCSLAMDDLLAANRLR